MRDFYTDFIHRKRLVITHRFAYEHLRRTGARRVCQVTAMRTTFLILRRNPNPNLTLDSRSRKEIKRDGEGERERRALESSSLRGVMALDRCVVVGFWVCSLSLILLSRKIYIIGLLQIFWASDWACLFLRVGLSCYALKNEAFLLPACIFIFKIQISD